jgi:hypothetical protein
MTPMVLGASRRGLREPPAVQALWSERLALFALAIAAVAILAVQLRLIPSGTALAALVGALLIAVGAIIFAVAGLVVIWRSGAPGAVAATRAIVFAAALLAVPVVYAVDAIRLPPLSDISTDLVDPPVFGRSRAALDAREGKVPGDYPRDKANEQLDAYPDIRPIVIDQGPDEAMTLTLRAISNLGWQVIDRAAPTGRVRVGRIEAIHRSLILRAPADITIRIRPLVGESRIDVRIVSRLGGHDFGAHAGRIRALQQEIAAVSAGG